MVVPTQILEIEVNCCGECPYYKDLRCSKGAHITKLPYMPFYDDCPLPFHEKDYDYIADLEAENIRLRMLFNKDKWIPVKSEVEPKLYQHVLTTVVACDGTEFLSHELYMGNFNAHNGFEVIAWQPAPELYKPKRKHTLPNEFKESIMKHFMRVE